VNKTQYDTLLQRLESARISESAEQNTESVKFRVIEPPTVPVKPSGPVRPALNSMVLLAAVAAGLGLAILFSLLHPTFTTRDLLQKVTGIRVIGTVTSAVRSGLVPWYQRQSVLVGGAVSLLLMVYLLNLVLSDSLRSVIRNVAG
jgi:DNA-binding transcriptional LysR family regulator